MRAVFICQALDEADAVHASVVRWVRELAAASDVDGVRVIALRTGNHRLPGNVKVVALSRGKARRLLSFYRAVFSAIRAKECDFFFVMQGGPYPLLLAPFRLFSARPIYQWKAHPAVTWSSRPYAWCDSLIFTSTEGSFPLRAPKVRVVGQGIDTDFFVGPGRPHTQQGIAIIGRVSRVKRIDQAIRAYARAASDPQMLHHLDIIGPTLPGDEGYAQSLHDLVAELRIQEKVRFLGAVRQSDLPDLLSRYKLMINFSTGAFDRSAGEAMACGLPVLTSNPCLADVIPAGCEQLLTTDAEQTDRQAVAIRRVLDLSPIEMNDLGRTLRRAIVTEHSLDRLWRVILEQIRGHIGLDTAHAGEQP